MRSSKEFMQKIPEALNVVKAFRQKLLNGEIPIEDLISLVMERGASSKLSLSIQINSK